MTVSNFIKKLECHPLIPNIQTDNNMDLEMEIENIYCRLWWQ